jgi:hypothetical protein
MSDEESETTDDEIPAGDAADSDDAVDVADEE